MKFILVHLSVKTKVKIFFIENGTEDCSNIWIARTEVSFYESQT